MAGFQGGVFGRPLTGSRGLRGSQGTNIPGSPAGGRTARRAEGGNTFPNVRRPLQTPGNLPDAKPGRRDEGPNIPGDDSGDTLPDTGLGRAGQGPNIPGTDVTVTTVPGTDNPAGLDNPEGYGVVNGVPYGNSSLAANASLARQNLLRPAAYAALRAASKRALGH